MRSAEAEAHKHGMEVQRKLHVVVQVGCAYDFARLLCRMLARALLCPPCSVLGRMQQPAGVLVLPWSRARCD